MRLCDHDFTREIEPLGRRALLVEQKYRIQIQLYHQNARHASQACSIVKEIGGGTTLALIFKRSLNHLTSLLFFYFLHSTMFTFSFIDGRTAFYIFRKEHVLN